MDSLYVTLIKLPILNTYSLFYVCLHSSTPGLRHIKAATKPVWCNYWSPHILEPVLHNKKQPQQEALIPQWRVAPTRYN